MKLIKFKCGISIIAALNLKINWIFVQCSTELWYKSLKCLLQIYRWICSYHKGSGKEELVSSRMHLIYVVRLVDAISGSLICYFSFSFLLARLLRCGVRSGPDGRQNFRARTAG